MSDYYGEPKLTQEEARVASENFLWNTKIWERHSIFIIKEYIENHDTELKITKSTTIILGNSGANFFKTHIEGKERYTQLVDIQTPFIQRVVTKVRQIGYTKTSEKLEENKDRFK